MPLPFILGAGALIAGAAGVGAGAHGAVKMKEASDTINSAKDRHEKNMEKFEKKSKSTSEAMDKLGTIELEILQTFDEFSKVFEEIKNKPVFKEYTKSGVTLPKYDAEKLKEVSVGAGVLLGGLMGAGLGAAGGFAAAGATTAAVMAVGTASTGTAIASLSGAAATNATLAALGGGIIASGGGGMALGTTVLGGATLGVGLLVGGIIFNIAGGKLSNQADEAWSQMREAEEKINTICKYLVELGSVSNRYYDTICTINTFYMDCLCKFVNMVRKLGHKDWNTFTQEEKILTENTVLLVGLLYNMCKVELVKKGNDDNEMNTINKQAIEKSIYDANLVMAKEYKHR